jgi:hypothetical protein
MPKRKRRTKKQSEPKPAPEPIAEIKKRRPRRRKPVPKAVVTEELREHVLPDTRLVALLREEFARQTLERAERIREALRRAF